MNKKQQKEKKKNKAKRICNSNHNEKILIPNWKYL
jgi:hypothetical protein